MHTGVRVMVGLVGSGDKANHSLLLCLSIEILASTLPMYFLPGDAVSTSFLNLIATVETYNQNTIGDNLNSGVVLCREVVLFRRFKK